jgi:hypothetical protein
VHAVTMHERMGQLDGRDDAVDGDTERDVEEGRELSPSGADHD